MGLTISGKRSTSRAAATVTFIDPHASTHLELLVQLLAEHQLQDLAVSVLKQPALLTQVAPAEQNL